MIAERATGIILRTRPLTDTSLIVQWLTPDLGRLSTVAKGARRPKSPFRGQIDLFYNADFSFVRSARSQLHTLREVRLLETHAPLRQNLTHLQQAAYCAKLIEQTTETETPLPVLFDIFNGLLREISHHPAQPQTVFAFEVKLLNELGLNPDPSDESLTSGVKQLIKQFGTLDWPALMQSDSDTDIPVCAGQHRQECLCHLRRFLHNFIIQHLERIPTGRHRALNP